MSRPVDNAATVQEMLADELGGSGRIGNRQDWLVRLALILILLLALAARLYALDGQSMWNDEGLSIYRATQSIPDILANIIPLDGVDTQDTNPALYFLLLHLWRAGAGESVFTYRALSVMAGVLSVAVFYQLGRISFNRPVGVAAAFLLALSPFHVWMSQEIRNYTLLLLFNLVSVYGLFRYASRPGKPGAWRWLVLWVAAGVAGIYTHLFGALVFAFGGLALLWLWAGRLRRERQWRPSRALVIILVVAGLISLPILWAGFARFRGEQQIDFVFVRIHHLASHALSAYATGLIQTFVQPLWRVLPAALLAIIGAIAGWRFSRRGDRRDLVWLILGYLLLPFLFLFLLSAVTPIYNGPRHLLIGLPPFLLLVAAGLGLPWTVPVPGSEQSGKPFWSKARLRRALVTILGIWLVLSQAQWLRAQFTSEQLIKDDFRGLAAYLSQVALEDDIIVLHDTISGPLFDFYYDGPAAWTTIPAFWQHDPQAAMAELQSAAESAQRLWFVTEPEPRTGFPRQYLSDWAEENWPVVSSQRFPWLWLRLKLDGFAPEPSIDRLPPEAIPLDSRWDEALALHGVTAPQEAKAGSFWQPTLYWSRAAAGAEDYRLSFRLVDELGQVWAQVDQPLWPQFPPDQWPEGQLIQHQPIIPLPAGLPPGDYQARLRVIRGSDMQPLKAGDAVEIQLSPSLVVEAARYPDDEQALPDHTPLNVILGGQIELVGASIPEGEYRPGHVAPVKVLWRVRWAPEKDYILALQLLDGQGQVVGESTATPSRAAYPSSSWQEDEYLLGQASVTIPANAKAETYTVRLALLDPDTQEPLRTGLFARSGFVDAGELPVTPWPLETQMPALPSPLRADFGTPPVIELHGYGLAYDDDASVDQVAPGDDLALTLFWRSLSEAIVPGQSVFVHLVDETGEIVAQTDGIPAGGFRPSTSWRQGEVIVDTHQLLIPADLDSGRYDLWIGLYDPETFLRLPVSVGGESLADDRLLLTRIQVSP